jgi:hypothetical protein
MRKCWRIEDVNGKGPYAAYDLSWTIRDHNYCIGKPGPREDGAALRTVMDGPSYHKHIFGFRSPITLRNWFDSPKENRQLHKAGFVVAEYEPEVVVVGRKQCAFIPKRRIRTHSISEWFRRTR